MLRDHRSLEGAWTPGGGRPPGSPHLASRRCSPEARGDRRGPPATSSCFTRRTDSTDRSSVSVCCYKTVLSPPWVGSLSAALWKHLASGGGRGRFPGAPPSGRWPPTPPAPPRSRGAGLAVPRAWRELQGGQGGGPLVVHLTLGPLQPPAPNQAPAKGRVSDMVRGCIFRIISVTGSPRNRLFQCFRGTAVSPTRGRPACVPACHLSWKRRPTRGGPGGPVRVSPAGGGWGAGLWPTWAPVTGQGFSVGSCIGDTETV